MTTIALFALLLICSGFLAARGAREEMPPVAAATYTLVALFCAAWGVGGLLTLVLGGG